MTTVYKNEVCPILTHICICINMIIIDKLNFQIFLLGGTKVLDNRHYEDDDQYNHLLKWNSG